MRRSFSPNKALLLATVLLYLSLGVSNASATSSGAVNNSETLILGTDTAAVGADVGMGALTLGTNATIDLTSANAGSELAFQTSDVTQWSGTNADSSLGQFANDAGTGFATAGMIVEGNYSAEFAPLAPVPEPATWAAAAMAVLALVLSQRRRLSALRRRTHLSRRPTMPAATIETAPRLVLSW